MTLTTILKDTARIGIVNRGEAALRFIRAAKEYNALHGTALKTVALYIDKEATSPFVRMADDVVPLSAVPGYPGRQKSPYLDHELVLAALERGHCDAIWVGWGFVSEDSVFAEKIEKAGIVFLGPSSSAMATLGDKIAAKELAAKAQVPILPWSEKSVTSIEEARSISEKIGYPVIVKAANAGGGRGIRFVRTPPELDKQFASAREETIRITGNDVVFIEYMVEKGRHLEVQVLADSRGNVNTFGVRDCSVQRKNQKIIEETPPPGLDAGTVAEMEAAAARLIRAAGYVGAATVEYLYDLKSSRFFFMEVNTRLQVEHPITETLYGVDLVKGQIDVARGLAVDLSGRKPDGCAIELRLNAEDPDRDFSPAPGVVTLLKVPAGPGIRVDSGIEQHSDIPSEFDSMVAKIIAWGADRAETMSRLKRALGEMRIRIKDGTTNRAFLLQLLERPEIARGGVHTGFVEELLRAGKGAPDPARLEAALMAGAIELYLRQRDDEYANFSGQLSRAGRPRSVPAALGHEVAVNALGRRYSFLVKMVGPDAWHIVHEGKELVCRYAINGQESVLVLGGVRRGILMVSRGDALQCEVDGVPILLEGDSGGYVKSPSPAIVLSLAAKQGDEVKKGDLLLVLEAMKMEMLIHAPADGTVGEVCVIKGAQVAAGQNLVRLAESAGAEAGTGAKAADSSPAAAFTALPRDEGEEWERLLRNFHALFLGYDAEGQASALFDRLRAFRDANPAYSGAFAEACVAAIRYYAALERLFTPRVYDSEAFARPMTGQELLSHYFRRDEGKGLPEDFLAAMKGAIDCYGGEGFRGAPPKGCALFNVFRSHARLGAKQELLKRVLFALAETGVDESLHDVLGTLLEDLIVLSDGAEASIVDAAVYARYQVIDSDRLKRIKKRHHEEIDALVNGMSGELSEEFLSNAEDTGPHIVPLLVTLALSEDAEKARSALLILGRRMNRDRLDPAVKIRESAGIRVADARGTEEGAPVCSLTAVLRAEDLSKGLSFLSCREVLLFVYASGTGAEAAALLSSPGALDPVSAEDGCRLTLGLVAADGTQSYRTYERSHGAWTEDARAREFSPLQYRELRVGRLRNFSLKFLYKSDCVLLAEATAESDKKDVRLIALVDASEIDEGEEGRLVLFEALFMEGVYAMRAAQARYKFRLHWNRIVVHIPALIAMGTQGLQDYGTRLLRNCRDLGLEKMVVYSRRKRWSEDQVREVELDFSEVARGQCLFRHRSPSNEPLEPLDAYVTQAVRARQRDTVYPYELLKMLTRSGSAVDDAVAGGSFEEWDVQVKPDGSQSPVSVAGREPGMNESNMVFGVVTNDLKGFPVPLRRVIILSDSTNDLGSLAEGECRRVIAALDLAEREGIPAEWVPVSSGARITMDSGTENLDWTAATLRRIVEYTQAGGELNIIVPSVNVGAQSYWNAEATMLMHTRGVLIMTDSASMLLTGKKALDFSGSVSGETNLDIGGAEKIMAPNGQAQFRAATIADAFKLLFEHYRYSYVPSGASFPPKTATTDPADRDVSTAPYKDFLGQGFATVGEIFSKEKNPERKKPFDMRQVMRALVDSDSGFLERWKYLQDSDTAIVWESRMGGNAVGMIGIESRNLPRIGEIPFDGPESWSGGTLFPLSSKKVARAVNAFSGKLPLVIVANLSGFDGSPESLRKLQLEYGAEIGRAVVNFKGPISFVVVARYHGGAYVVFSKSLNTNLRAAALAGSYASVIGGAPAAAVVFPKAVTVEIYADERIIKARAALKAGEIGQAAFDLLYEEVRNEKQTRLGQEFDKIHSVERARAVGSIDDIVDCAGLRPYIIKVIEDGMKHCSLVGRGMSA